MIEPTFQPGDMPEDQNGKIEFNLKGRSLGKTLEAKRQYQEQINKTELERLYTEHPIVKDLTRNDADVYAWFKMAKIGACTVEEALVGALVHVQERKQHYFDEVIDLTRKRVK